MSLPDTIQRIIESYRSLPLEKAEAVKFMCRMDTKYILQVDAAIQLLHDLQPDYYVLEIASQRTGAYTSVYYDTSDMQMFYAHVTGRFPRYKVRERTYSQNGLKFFEVKRKNIAGRTFKRRIPIADDDDRREANQWLSQKTPFCAEELSPVLINCFERITLINNERTERATLDFNLHFRTPSGTATQVYDRVAIVELKQDKTADSPIRKYLRSKGIRPQSVSKYCLGILFTGCETGYKRYKPNYSRFLKTQFESHD